MLRFVGSALLLYVVLCAEDFANPACSAAIDGEDRDEVPHPLEMFLLVASPAASVTASAFLSKREAASSAAARTMIDEFLLEELRRLAALPPPSADVSPASQFVAEWQVFTRGAEWQAFSQQETDKGTLQAWRQWRAFGAEHDRAMPLVATTVAGVDAAAVVASVGVVRLDAVLSRTTAARLRAYVLTARDAGAGELSRVLSARDTGRDVVTRWDIRLPWDAPVQAAVREMLREGGQLGDALRTLSGGDEAELIECASIISAEGAAPQVVHSDTVAEFAEEGPQLHTAFIALQDVAPHHGPTRFLASTHCASLGVSTHQAVGRDEPGFYEGASSVSALLRAGDCTLYDSRLLHSGGPHRRPPPSIESSERVLFYVSFKHVNASQRSEKKESSIMPDVAAMGMRLGELCTSKFESEGV